MITTDLLNEYNYYKNLGFKHTTILKNNLSNTTYVCILPLKLNANIGWIEILK